MNIQGLINFFDNNELPNSPVIINKYMTITDCNNFVDSHLSFLKSKNKESIKLTYYDRLIMFVNFIKENNNSKEETDVHIKSLDNQQSLF